MSKQVSPVPKKQTAKTMPICEALMEIVGKKRVTRLEWDTNDEYCYLSDDGFLSIHREGKDHRWLINDGDLLGEDWVVIPQVN